MHPLSQIELSESQKLAIQNLAKWLKEDNRTPYITLGGYAGTGKTTIIGLFRKILHDRNSELKVAFCSYTGKATRVLTEKLAEHKATFPQDSTSTIHSLIYSPILDDDGQVTGWEKRDINTDNLQLIVIDEASMVTKAIWDDLLAYNIPIIALGDHGQLPPIGSDFNLMQEPMLRLEEIHRQAKENPIIELSIMARQTGSIPIGNYSSTVKKLDRSDSESQYILNEVMYGYDENTMVLVGYNNSRIRFNKSIREMLEFERPEPQSGDQLICLRNNRIAGIYNGMMGKIISIESVSSDKFGDHYFTSLLLDDRKTYKGNISSEQFNTPKTLSETDRELDLFDFGYAITVHKSQGSQAKRVVLIEERFKRMSDEDWRRWLYTAVTRAEEELYIIGS